jgi:membrane protease YdiL (CAAX protease family)
METQNQSSRREGSTSFRASLAYALLSIASTAVLFGMAVCITRRLALPHTFLPSSFYLQSIYLIVILLLMALLSRGRLQLFGFACGSFRLSWRYFAWLIPPLTMGIAGALQAHSNASAGAPLGLSKLQIVIFIWIYSSFCEEVLTRGFLQTLLSRALGKNRFGITVFLSGLFFGLMHLIAIRQMGPGVVVFATYLGMVAAYYRQKSGSIYPAMLLHLLFNISGTLPLWVIQGH